MIGRLTGTLLEKLPPTICLDVQGVGYEMDVPMSTLYDLPEAGGRVTLYTHLAIREDAHVLYGFLRNEERMVFRALIKVSGVGARTALAVLSGMSVQELSSAVSRQETARLTRVPGIGKKTADRLLLELRGKLGADLGSPAGTLHSQQDDIIHALLALGYSNNEVQTALKKLPDEVGVAEGIRLALQALARH